ncbi:GNAT family N-acetyltransferase [Lentzea sp. DG1S-22]|uniref:GNAT family N-acetyltransferase n=1 Tax=Lentzea sp. DG1S-22 TaxID=3108822 RepID=UPI002E7960C1|nr:GNAT family N-acetyltransferase [Lentzea sp. DG1S-22]WVH79383.1 GNAT family N-acetyltransferase [Lentzea sp. DG1S-22]
MLRDAATAVGVLVTMNWEADAETTGIHDVHFIVIGTLPSHRDRGVASTLIAHALHTVFEQGYDRALLTVDSANAHGASRTSEKARFTATKRYVKWALEI